MNSPESEKALRQTIQSYDQTAAIYAERTYNIPLPAQRERFLEYLANPGAAILDLGCGPGRDTTFYQEQHYRVVGADLSAGMLEEARRRLPGGVFVQADMRQLPFKEDAFQGIWASASLLHLPRASAPLALREMRRVLGPDGLLFVAVKRKQREDESWREPAEAPARFHFTYYTAEELAESVRQAGFALLSLSENFSLTQNHPDGSPVCWINLYARTVAR